MKKLDAQTAEFLYESRLCDALLFSESSGADVEEQLVGVLEVLVRVANAAGLENLALYAEQQIIGITGLVDSACATLPE